MSCLICDRINLIKNGNNPFFVMELQTGYVVLGDTWRFKGYTLFLCKKHVSELHELEYDYKMKFLEEMSIVAEALDRLYKPDKINYELLGNGYSHLHWHLFPRFDGDTKVKGPVWWIPKEEMFSEKYKLSEEELSFQKQKLKNEIEKLINAENK